MTTEQKDPQLKANLCIRYLQGMANSYESCTRSDQFCGAITILGHLLAIDHSTLFSFCSCCYDQTYVIDSTLNSPCCKVDSSPIGVGLTRKKRKDECTERQLIFPQGLKSYQSLDQRIIRRWYRKKTPACCSMRMHKPIDENAYKNVENDGLVGHRKCRTAPPGPEPESIRFVFAKNWTIGLVRSSPFGYLIELLAFALRLPCWVGRLPFSEASRQDVFYLFFRQIPTAFC